MFLRHSSPMRATPLRTAWINVTKCLISKEVEIDEDIDLNSEQDINDYWKVQSWMFYKFFVYQINCKRKDT